MNKKKIGALLVGATLLVGAMGSFAYFTGGTSVIGGSDNGKLQAITITNGNVNVSGTVTNNGTDNLDWSYDVVKYSLEEGTQRDPEFINHHRTPDIAEAAKTVVNGIPRVEVGAALPTTINYTRPGDAIVLGVPNEAGQIGLVVTNSSKLTVKMQLVVKDDENAQAMIGAMNDAGWEFYVNGEKMGIAGGEIIGLGVVSPETTLDRAVDIRFELPLLTGNNKQNLKNVNNTVKSLNLSDIFEIQATQENNPGWNQDGSDTDRISDETEITQPENGQDQPEGQE